MMKKWFTPALSICILLMPSFAMTGMAYAGTAEVNYLTGNDVCSCDYSHDSGIAIQIPETTQQRSSRSVARSVSLLEQSHEPISGASADGTARIGKQTLQNMERAERLLYAYEQLANAIDCFADTAEVSKSGEEITPAELTMIYNLVREDYPEFFWWGHGSYSYWTNGDGNVVRIQLADRTADPVESLYLFDTYEETVAANTAFEAKTSEILESCSKESIYDIELYFHDWLALNNTYQESEHAHNAFGAIMGGEVVCEGYTRAMQLLLNKKNIENYTVTGTSRGIGHIWNIVKMDDGQWYQTDVTWDDQGDEANDIFYAYFNITTDKIVLDHYIGTADDPNYANYIALPECTATDYWYYSVNPECMIDVSSTVDLTDFANKLKQQFENTTGFARIYAAGDTPEDKKLGQSYNKDFVRQVAASLGYGAYSYGYSYMGYTEYHFSLTQYLTTFGYLEQGNTNLDDVIIRYYPAGTDKGTIEEKIILPRDEDGLCFEEAEFDSTGWVENTYYNGETEATEYWGTWYKPFGAFLPEKKCIVAIYKEGYGLFVKEVLVGRDGQTLESALNDNRLVIYRLGDLDDNENVDSSDNLFLARYIAGWQSYRRNGNRYAADINKDGKVDIVDLTILQRHLAGWNDFENLVDYENGDKIF